MKLAIRNALYVLTVLLIFTGTALAQDSTKDRGGSGFSSENFHPDYPGIGDGIVQNVGQAMLQDCIRAYYKVYGFFPSSWQEVVDKGLCSRELLGYQMQVIDPDDGSLDFPGDIYVEFKDGEAIVHIRTLNRDDDSQSLGGPDTYVETLQRIIEIGNLSDAQKARFEAYCEDEQQLLQFGILGTVSHALMMFNGVHGHSPESLDEFLDSGISPITRNTINPLTGKPFRFDGSPGDVFAQPTERSFIFTHMDTEGINETRFTYF